MGMILLMTCYLVSFLRILSFIIYEHPQSKIIQTGCGDEVRLPQPEAKFFLFVIVRLRLIQSQSLNIYLFLPSKPSLLINVFQCQDCVVFVSRLYFTRTITHCLLSRVYKILRLQIYQSLTKTKLF